MPTPGGKVIGSDDSEGVADGWTWPSKAHVHSCISMALFYDLHNGESVKNAEKGVEAFELAQIDSILTEFNVKFWFASVRFDF